jgi:hypothetical protein
MNECVLRTKTKVQNLSLIKGHAPTEEKEQLEMKAFYQKAEEVYDSCPSNDIKIVLGAGMPKWRGKKSTKD